jgi:predicted RNA-binding protein associated with RNAse of E/G family
VKRKLATIPEWQRVIAKRFAVTPLAEPDFTGYVALLTFDAINSPGWLAYGEQRLLIADNGYCWLQYYPRDAHYTLTATFDERDRFVYWYIDIVKAHGLDDDGIPWYDDLYLDIIILDDGAIHVLDADDLDEALAAQRITQDDWQLAWDETNRLLAALQHGPLPAMMLYARHLALLRSMPMLTLTREVADA